MESDIASLVGSVGFPIAMCFWFMYRTEGYLKANTDALQALATLLRGKTQ